MIQATYKLLVDWDGDGLFANTESNVWKNAISVSTTVGRDYGSQVIGRSIAGQLTAQLHDNTGLYSRFNSNSPLFGLALPSRKVRLTMQMPGETETTIWSGYLDSIRPQPQRGAYSVVELRALGIIGLLTENSVSVSVQTDINPKAAIDLVLDAAGIATADRDIDDGVADMPHWWSLFQPALEALREIEHTEPGFIRELPDGRIRFESRYHRAQGLGRISQAIFADTTGTGHLRYRAINVEDPIKDVANIVKVPIREHTDGSEAVLWQSPDVPRPIPPNPRPATATPVRDSDTPDIDGVAIEWITLLAGTDYVANSARDGSGADMTSSLQLTVEYFALSLDIDSIENTSSQTIYLTKLQARGKVLELDREYEEFGYDDDSIVDYGRRTYRFPAGFIADRQEARGFIDVALRQTSIPHPKVSLQVDANASDDLLEKAISLEVSDRVSLIADGVSHLGIDEDFYIEAIGHDIMKPAVHRTRYVLSAAIASGIEKVIVLAPTPPIPPLLKRELRPWFGYWSTRPIRQDTNGEGQNTHLP